MSARLATPAPPWHRGAVSPPAVGLASSRRRRRFLLISYFFPPHGGAGVQRALHLCRLASELGWEPIVLASSTLGTATVDRSLLAKIPAGVVVERVPMISSEPVRTTLAKLGLGRWYRALPVDAYLGWYPFAAARARTLVERWNVDLVFSSSSPYTAHLVAAHARARSGCPWVADFRDPWTDNRFLPVYRETDTVARFRQRVDARLERRVFDEAARITVTAAPLRDLFVAHHGIDAERVALVPNGFDEADFPSRHAFEPRRRGPRFRILFGGNIYGDYNLSALFQASDRLLARREIPELEIVVVTRASAWVERELPKHPNLRGRVEVRAPVAHDEIVRLYRGADALALCALDPLSVPGKLFEYVAAGPPVLAFVVPDTDAERIVEATGTGVAASAADPDAGARAIETVYEAWRRGAPATVRREHEIAELTRRNQTKRLCAIFDDVVGSAETKKAIGAFDLGNGQGQGHGWERA